MRSRFRYARLGSALTAVAAVFGWLGVSGSSAQTVPPGAPQPSTIGAVPSADFLFGPPRGSLGLRAGFLVPGEGSDLFDFFRDQLTVDKGDFRGPAFAADVGFAVTDRLDVVGGVEFARKQVASDYRDFVDNALRPIEQQSALNQNLVTASVRLALTPRGQRAGTYAWVPSRITPYVGAGGGLIWWRLQQSGDFVDFEDFRVFSDTFESSGVSPAGHVLAGADIQLYKRLFLTTEGRYVWASGTLDRDFVGFEPIDLSGFRLSAGFNVVF
jgi:hypothetical protein